MSELRKLILVIDDEKGFRDNLCELLSDEGFQTLEAGRCVAALEVVAKTTPDLILLDVKLPDAQGTETLQRLRELRSDVPVIIMTAYGSSRLTIEAMKQGAFDYITKPFDLDELLITIKRAVSYKDIATEVANLREVLTDHYAVGDIIGNSLQMREICKTIGRVALSDTTVLVRGESGTGKELIAHAIHYFSHRKDKPLIRVNCAALNETLLESELFGHERGAFTGAIARHKGRFELAQHGTLFLDEIGDMSPGLQAKMLRVLEDREIVRVGGESVIPVDTRVIAATNKNLEAAIQSGEFRKDLYYRLSVVCIDLPPLRSRKEDIRPLVDHFIRKLAPTKPIKGITHEALDRLLRYDWPGNVRELENVIQRAIILASDVITIDHVSTLLTSPELPAEPKPPEDARLPFKEIIADTEKQLIIQALNRCGWNQSKAAEMLKINRRLLFSKIKQYHITRPNFL